MKLAAARIFVRNLEKAKTFYETSLGLRVKAQNLDFGFVVFDAQSCDPSGNELQLVEYPSPALAF